ncbi:protein of unknown function [Paenibacillus sp. UNC496MF]|uniref:DUF4352 domain-containing protein n=1 Tax=Paenibacillus sp. UNC496MF TaxID=1502753 RepID=UPI0008DEF02B|nr:DUF4352 domain-containing protein [Paenibacillus sp. UNC496MF]SFJ67878.1 protein of unknown function [Paenibacillus sp. UNC496MF]
MSLWKYMLLAGVTAVVLSGCTEAHIEKVNSAPAGNVDSKAANTPQTESNTVTKESETKAETPQFFKKGESVKFDDLVITVNGARESKGELFTADTGNVILLVDVTAENKGTEEASVSSMLQTKMVDGDGYQYNLTIAEDAKGSFDGAIASGRKIRGEIAYEVPKDASSLEFVFSDPFKKGEAIWKLK